MDTSRSVTVLGAFDAQPVARLTSVGRRLLANLALNGGARTRSVVYGDLWPEVAEERARANLRRALWQLPRGWVMVEGLDLRLAADVDLVGARQVARQCVRDGLLDWDDLRLLESDVLPGWSEEWLASEQESFHLLRTQALEAACRRATSQRNFTLATQAGLRAVQSEPLRESAVEALVEAALSEGNRHLAVHHYKTFARTLAQELRVRPDQRLQVLVAGLVDDEAQAGPTRRRG